MTLTKNTLCTYFLESAKPLYNKKIGIEIEHFICKTSNLLPLTSQETLDLIAGLPNNTWNKEYFQGKVYKLNNNTGNISLEPGLQVEFSSTPESNLNILENSYNLVLEDIHKISLEKQYSLFALGHHPFLSPSSTPFLPYPRYTFMYDYMPKVETLGRNMMKNTTTLQTNLDFHNEHDLCKKIQALANITPFLIYFSASSPFKNKKITHYLSYRNYIWEHTDNQRTGMPSFFFKGQFTIEKYVDYIINIPLYFIIRNNNYIYNTNNYTFLDLMINKIEGFSATLEDFVLHLSTTFLDIRIKRYLEIRSCDTMGIHNILSIPALLTGLIYNDTCLEEICSLTKTWDKTTFLSLKKHLNTKGLTNDIINNINLLNFSHLLLDLATYGLQQRKLNEERFLTPLYTILKTQTNLAQQYIETFKQYNNIFDFTRTLLWK